MGVDQVHCWIIRSNMRYEAKSAFNTLETQKRKELAMISELFEFGLN